MHPLHAASIAAGRADAPTLPREFLWINLTAHLNRALGTTYKPDELRALPSDELSNLLLYVQETHE